MYKIALVKEEAPDSSSVDIERCIINLAYNDQLENDHCVSSSILIGMELTRLFRAGNGFPDVLSAPDKRRRFIIDRIRQHKTVKQGNNIENIWITCKCELKFRSSNRVGYSNHMRVCSGMKK